MGLIAGTELSLNVLYEKILNNDRTIQNLDERLSACEDKIISNTESFGVVGEYEYTGVIETIVEGEIVNENT